MALCRWQIAFVSIKEPLSSLKDLFDCCLDICSKFLFNFLILVNLWTGKCQRSQISPNQIIYFIDSTSHNKTPKIGLLGFIHSLTPIWFTRLLSLLIFKPKKSLKWVGPPHLAWAFFPHPSLRFCGLLQLSLCDHLNEPIIYSFYDKLKEFGSRPVVGSIEPWSVEYKFSSRST